MPLVGRDLPDLVEKAAGHVVAFFNRDDTHLLLLRKRDGEKKFEMIRRFELLNVKESITQGQLFI